MTTWASFWSRSEQDLHLNYLLVKKPKRNKPPLVFYFIDQSSLLDFSGHLGLLQWLYEGHVTNGLYSCYPIPPHFVNFLEKFSIGDNLIQHQHNERTLYVFFFPSSVFFAITDWHLAIKWLNFIREEWNLLLGHLLSPWCFYIKLVGGKENGEVLAPPSWASWVDEIFSGQFGGYFASWMWKMVAQRERAEGLAGELLWVLRGPLPPTWWVRSEHAHWVRNWVWWFPSSHTSVRLSWASRCLHLCARPEDGELV